MLGDLRLSWSEMASKLLCLSATRLIIQPDAGVAPIVTAIKQAKKSDRHPDLPSRSLREIARALGGAVPRGVRVRALTAHQQPRRHQEPPQARDALCSRGGVTVSRTADDLVRYHGKMMILDGSDSSHVYGFNFTGLDIAQEPQLRRRQQEPASSSAEAIQAVRRPTSTARPYSPG